ncbi:MAG: hypothetical protein KAI79_14440 [Bacteroidales bacterium]|nr:hypothetical protein [Bacteroidales bacterium]
MEKLTILELAKKLNVHAPVFVCDYSNQFDDITPENIDDLESVIEYDCFQDQVSEYADSNTPIYYNDIDSKYDSQVNSNGISIDDAINDGMCQPMKSESDISKAKQVALYMQIEIDTYSELEDFKTEMINAVDNDENLETFECLECNEMFFKSEESKKEEICKGCHE